MATTRVEKFKEYREEIKNSVSESDFTTKRKTSDRVEKILDSQDPESKNTTSISFDEVMEAYRTYGKGENKETSPLEKKHKKLLTYIVVACIVCTILLASCIVVGVLTFGGK